MRNQYLESFAATSVEIGWHPGKPAPSELDRLEREVASTGAEIHSLAYELYGIAHEERKIML